MFVSVMTMCRILLGACNSMAFPVHLFRQRAPVPRAKMLFWEWRFAVAGTCDNAAPNIAVRDGVWKYMQVRSNGHRKTFFAPLLRRSVAPFSLLLPSDCLLSSLSLSLYFFFSFQIMGVT